MTYFRIQQVLLLLVAVSGSAFFYSCKTTKVSESIENSTAKIEWENITPQSAEDAVLFNELWGYVMIKRESEFNARIPVSDVGYFVNAVDVYSRLLNVPERSEHFLDYGGKVHLVTSCDSRSQTHLLLSEKNIRDRIIDDLISASATYEGLQVDWELVPKKDKEFFLEFLSELKNKLGGKILSVAVPARLKTLENDAYDYSDIAKIADRIIVMAYDEHWSTSKPGPVASTDWCKRICEYARTVISEEKLVMGASFYGRAWSSDKEGGRAYYSSDLVNLKARHKIDEDKILRDEGGIPNFTFTKKIEITCWYDDIASLKTRCKMYRDSSVKKLSFWRVGQEDILFWEHIGLE